MKKKKNPSNKTAFDEFKTRRVTVKKLENMLHKTYKVLDHGFIRVIDYMGDDSAIVQAARVSYGKGTKRLSQDKSLINYLMSHRHSTPFEMNEIKFHIKLPIFVARQWIRHRTANVNEYSARYSILDKEFYVPEKKDIKPQSKSNNQGRSGDISMNEKMEYLKIIQDNSEVGFKNYNKLLNSDEAGEMIDENKQGVARELARMTLPLNSYTQWYWKIDLHNLMNFLSLRFDYHAQYEIRKYAEVMIKILKNWVPLTYDSFLDNRINSTTLSSKGIEFIKSLIKNEYYDQKKLSKRELAYIKEKFKI